MTHLVIITPKDGNFAYLLNSSSEFKKSSASADYAYFTYFGDVCALDKACDLLSSFRFKEFSLDKETNYYRLKVYVE